MKISKDLINSLVKTVLQEQAFNRKNIERRLGLHPNDPDSLSINPEDFDVTDVVDKITEDSLEALFAELDFSIATNNLKLINSVSPETHLKTAIRNLIEDWILSNIDYEKLNKDKLDQFEIDNSL